MVERALVQEPLSFVAVLWAGAVLAAGGKGSGWVCMHGRLRDGEAAAETAAAGVGNRPRAWTESSSGGVGGQARSESGTGQKRRVKQEAKAVRAMGWGIVVLFDTLRLLFARCSPNHSTRKHTYPMTGTSKAAAAIASGWRGGKQWTGVVAGVGGVVGSGAAGGAATASSESDPRRRRRWWMADRG